MTAGRAIVMFSAWRRRSERSSTSARSLRIRTTARRTVQTLIGSYEALRTRTRVVFTSGASLPGGSGVQHRIRAEHLERLDPPGERVESLADLLVAGRAVEVGEEHVVP